MSRVISVEHLSKIYRLGSIGSGTLRTDLRNLFRSTARSNGANGTGHVRGSPRTEGGLFWALRDVNFDVSHGEALAIIGRNGAGKSTLLKILSRITAPSKGAVRVRGHFASLLEVGTGFHPDLTGRENIFLNGAILGMSKAEIEKKFDEIVDFSGVAQFLDTPVKRYSSGMYVRLAFAVAAHLDSEILIMDEVLAVGDASFQRKCLGKMSESAKEGRTVLFVSHNMVAVQSLCSRAIMLSDGEIVADGAVRDVVAHYLGSGLEEAEGERCWDDVETAPGNESIRIRRIRVAAADGEGELLGMSTPLRIEVDHTRLSGEGSYHIELHLVNQEEIVALYTTPGPCPASPGTYRSVCEIPGNVLNSSMYRLKVMLVEDDNRAVWLDSATTSFSIEDLGARNEGWMDRLPGVVHIPFEWQTESI